MYVVKLGALWINVVIDSLANSGSMNMERAMTKDVPQASGCETIIVEKVYVILRVNTGLLAHNKNSKYIS